MDYTDQCHKLQGKRTANVRKGTHVWRVVVFIQHAGWVAAPPCSSVWRTGWGEDSQYACCTGIDNAQYQATMQRQIVPGSDIACMRNATHGHLIIGNWPADNSLIVYASLHPSQVTPLGSITHTGFGSPRAVSANVQSRCCIFLGSAKLDSASRRHTAAHTTGSSAACSNAAAARRSSRCLLPGRLCDAAVGLSRLQRHPHRVG